VPLGWDEKIWMQILLSQFEIARLPTLLRRLGAWWLKEFLELFPERVAERLAGKGRTLLVAAVDQEGITLQLLNGAGTPIASERATPGDNALAEMERLLRSGNIQRRDVDIGLRLPAERLFRRQLLLPAEAIDSIDAIVAQDLAKKTPFKPEDIYSDHTLERVDGNKIAVRQWITRRQYVQQALSALNIDIGQLAFLVFEGSEAERPAPLINLRPEAQLRRSWYRKAHLILCCSAFVLATLAGGLKYWDQQATMDRLDAQIAAVGSKAQQVRALVDQLQAKKNALLRLRLQRSEAPGLIDLWEETTRVLPSHSQLTEFRLVEIAGKREAQVTLSGFSSAAPSLVAIIDSSPLFYDAALTSPIAFDATEGRERFALQARVRMPEAFKEAGR
jgi:general secretion pathway protein L